MLLTTFHLFVSFFSCCHQTRPFPGGDPQGQALRRQLSALHHHPGRRGDGRADHHLPAAAAQRLLLQIILPARERAHQGRLLLDLQFQLHQGSSDGAERTHAREHQGLLAADRAVHQRNHRRKARAAQGRSGSGSSGSCSGSGSTRGVIVTSIILATVVRPSAHAYASVSSHRQCSNSHTQQILFSKICVAARRLFTTCTPRDRRAGGAGVRNWSRDRAHTTRTWFKKS